MATAKRRGRIALAVALVLGLVVALSFLIELPIPHDRDFYDFYVSNLAVRYHLGLYDEVAQAALYARLYQVDVSTINSIQWVYPPWYNLATLYLAWLPIRVAVRLWFYLNLIMLVASIGFLTVGWPDMRRQLALTAGMLFVPALGVLSVGQLVMPVLLGSAFIVHGARRQRAWALGIGVVLLGFKPPAGVPIALVGGGWLLARAARGSEQANRALAIATAAFALCLAGGFLLDPRWPADLLASLQRNGGFDVSVRCDSCASLTFVLARRLAPSTWGPWMLAGLLVVFLATVTWWQRPRAMLAGDILTSVAVLITLLASPYLRNYDYVLLLVPLALCVEAASGIRDWLVIAIAYVVPWLSVLIPGRPGGSEFMWISAALLLGLAVRSNERPTVPRM